MRIRVRARTGPQRAQLWPALPHASCANGWTQRNSSFVAAVPHATNINFIILYPRQLTGTTGAPGSSEGQRSWSKGQSKELHGNKIIIDNDADQAGLK